MILLFVMAPVAGERKPIEKECGKCGRCPNQYISGGDDNDLYDIYRIEITEQSDVNRLKLT